MKVYLAAPYRLREQIVRYRDELISLGFEITSRWLDGLGQRVLNDGSELGPEQERVVEAFLAGETDDSEALRLSGICAQADIRDVYDSDVLIAFTSREAKRGGMHVEWGYAIAAGKTLAVVGPREHIFHCLPDVEAFVTWDQCVMWLLVLKRECSATMVAKTIIQRQNNGDAANPVLDMGRTVQGGSVGPVGDSAGSGEPDRSSPRTSGNPVGNPRGKSGHFAHDRGTGL